MPSRPIVPTSHLPQALTGPPPSGAGEALASADPRAAVVSLHSGGIAGGPWLVAHPTRVLQLPANSDFAAWRAFAKACGLGQKIRREAAAASAQSAGAIAPGWIYQLSFELGEVLEPAIVRTPAHAGRGRQLWPLAAAWRVEAPANRRAEGAGLGASVCALEKPSEHDREAYEAAVAACLAYVRAGDVYQANIAHELKGLLRGASDWRATRALAAALWRAAQPWFGAYLELPGGEVICSASPELFLRYAPSEQRLRTRPMKGTRAGLAAGEELSRSAKDRAELAMIVDLMRNDLGRVCELGSMRVDAAHEVEAHGYGASSLLQATATVSGVPTQATTWSDVIEACFPPGSVTGAPKVRAVQIIRELEPTLRGPYCGCIGFVSDSGEGVWNVAIRTACVRGGALSWHVGAGIVAESTPSDEWLETLAKARALQAIAAKT